MTKIDPTDLKPGQRVRVTFEAEVSVAKSAYLRFELVKGAYTTFDGSEFPALTCELLPDPIEVGDRVQHNSGPTGTVLALHNDRAWVDDGYPCPSTWDLRNLTKIEGDA